MMRKLNGCRRFCCTRPLTPQREFGANREFKGEGTTDLKQNLSPLIPNPLPRHRNPKDLQTTHLAGPVDRAEPKQRTVIERSQTVYLLAIPPPALGRRFPCRPHTSVTQTGGGRGPGPLRAALFVYSNSPGPLSCKRSPSTCARPG